MGEYCFHHSCTSSEHNYITVYQVLTAWRVIQHQKLFFVYLFILFHKKAGEAAIKVNRTHMHLEILNNIINDHNRNISEEVNFKRRESFLVDQQGGWGGIGVGGVTSIMRDMNRGQTMESEAEEEGSEE